MAAVIAYLLRRVSLALARRPANLVTGLSLATALAFLAVTHGLLPGLNAPSLDVQSSFLGMAKCAADSGNIFALSCERVGYPIGVRPLVGYPIEVFLAFLYKYLSLPLLEGLQVFGLMALAVGFGSLFWLVRTYTGSAVAAVTAALVFYSSPFVLGMSGFGSLYYAFLLFPFYIAVSLRLFQYIRQGLAERQRVVLAAASAGQVALFSFAILMDGYSFIMAVITAGILSVGLMLWQEREMALLKRALILAFYGGLLLLPGVLYGFLVFESPSQFASSSDFMRGQGIDLATVVIPTQRWLFADWLDLGPTSWNAYRFYGDGHNANLNFLGFVAPLAAAGAVLLLRRAPDRRVIAGLFAAVFVVGFVFSLGPSLKIEDVRGSRPVGEVKYQDYLMPAQAATLSLPTARLYALPGIDTMRAVYRWQLMSRFAMVVLVGFFMVQIAGKKAILVPLAALLVMESIPLASLEGQDRYSLNRTQHAQFTRDVVDELRPYIADRDRLLFLPAQNDFLITLMVPFTGGYAYNTSFDKEIARIQPLQPPEVIGAGGKFREGSLAVGDLRHLFDEGLVDKVVFTYFNLRWDSYWWPPAKKTVNDYRQRVTELGLASAPGLRTFEEAYFLVVEPQGNATAQRESAAPAGGGE